MKYHNFMMYYYVYCLLIL